MEIRYETRKDLPCKALHRLFVAVGWSEEQIPSFMIENFNRNFINSTLVYSAWKDEELVGCVRVLSDKMFRSVIYDLAVHPNYQNKGIGKTLLKMCTQTYPDSEWMVETENAAEFYKKFGFTQSQNVFLTIPCKWF